MELIMLAYLAGVLLYQIMLIAFVSIFTIALMEKNKENFRRIGLFAVVFLVYFVMRILPQIIGFQNFNLPWESRFLTIISGILLFFLFRKYFSENNYLKLKHDKQNLKITLFIAIVTIIGYFFVLYLRRFSQEFNMELMLFMSTVSVIEEELFFRVLILGLLMSCLNEKVLFNKYSAAVLSGIIFGFWHGTFFNFDVLNIITNCVYGSLVGLITIKNKSIVVPVIVHVIINTFGHLINIS
jgi:membrane protease YdiL (CAAX protease family)